MIKFKAEHIRILKVIKEQKTMLKKFWVENNNMDIGTYTTINSLRDYIIKTFKINISICDMRKLVNTLS